MQVVVRYIKFLPTKYTNLVEPKSMYLEDLVNKVAQQIPMAARQPGAAGTHVLLTGTLQVGSWYCGLFVARAVPLCVCGCIERDILLRPGVPGYRF
jgi:hypothetical protein